MEKPRPERVRGFFVFTQRGADQYLAMGRITLNSKIDCVARREGNTIYIDGEVTHGLSDTYDFLEDQPGAENARRLIEMGRANEFKINAEWTQKISGTIQIENGKLTDPQIAWTD